MKKHSKIVALGLATVTAFSMATMGLVACGDDENGAGGGISDSQWSSVLNFDAEKYNNYTIVRKDYNTYGKDQVEEYGEWSMRVNTIKIDMQNELYSDSDEYEHYKTDAQDFVTENNMEYCFKYNQAYYRWDNSYSYESAYISSLTKADMINKMESYNHITDMFQAYSQPAVKALFKYNSKTGMYETSQLGMMNLSLQFLEGNGIRIVMKENSIKASEIIVKDINKTTITVPNNVKTDVDAYIAEQDAENA